MLKIGDKVRAKPRQGKITWLSKDSRSIQVLFEDCPEEYKYQLYMPDELELIEEEVKK